MCAEEDEKPKSQIDMEEGSDKGEAEEEQEERKEYVKKEYFARPYESDGVTEAAVNELIIKNTR